MLNEWWNEVRKRRGGKAGWMGESGEGERRGQGSIVWEWVKGEKRQVWIDGELGEGESRGQGWLNERKWVTAG